MKAIRELLGQLLLGARCFGFGSSIQHRYLSLIALVRTTLVVFELLRLSEQFLPVRLDIGGKAQRMIARALLGQFSVARFQRLDHAHMLGEGRRSAIGASDS